MGKWRPAGRRGYFPSYVSQSQIQECPPPVNPWAFNLRFASQARHLSIKETLVSGLTANVYDSAHCQAFLFFFFNSIHLPFKENTFSVFFS